MAYKSAEGVYSVTNGEIAGLLKGCDHYEAHHVPANVNPAHLRNILLELQERRRAEAKANTVRVKPEDGLKVRVGSLEIDSPNGFGFGTKVRLNGQELTVGAIELSCKAEGQWVCNLIFPPGTQPCACAASVPKTLTVKPRFAQGDRVTWSNPRPNQWGFVGKVTAVSLEVGKPIRYQVEDGSGELWNAYEDALIPAPTPKPKPCTLVTDAKPLPDISKWQDAMDRLMLGNSQLPAGNPFDRDARKTPREDLP